MCVIAIFSFVKPYSVNWQGTTWPTGCSIRIFDCLLEYLSTVVGTANNCEGLGPARPTLAIVYITVVKTEPDLSLISYSFARFFSYYASILLVASLFLFF